MNSGVKDAAIEVRGLTKTFRIPQQHSTTLKERVLRPWQRNSFYELNALDNVSFDVGRGDFFGIIGRNGSGKTSLLRLIASIHKPDRGTIRVAGLVAPFIELGIGFNAELTARDNVVLNGVMMGLSRREAAQRFEQIIEMAGLESFVDLQLKNYSSGMRTRLGFAVMAEADADVLLADEVLAVGDAEFQQRCLDTFERLRRAGRTIVLVTHNMSAIRLFCEHALMLEKGKMVAIGDPDVVADQYLAANIAANPDENDFETPELADPDPEARGPDSVDLAGPKEGQIVKAWLEGAPDTGEGIFEPGETIRLHALVLAREALHGPAFGFGLSAEDGRRVFGSAPSRLDTPTRALADGEMREVVVTFRNVLSPGRYTISCTLGWKTADDRPRTHLVPDAVRLTVPGDNPGGSVIDLDFALDVTCSDEQAPAAEAEGAASPSAR